MPRPHVTSSKCANVESLENRCLLSVLTVVNTTDTGAGSLRQALLDANASPGADAIQFAIPGTDVHTIQPQTLLPISIEPLVIDGYTQAGSSPNTNPPGTNPNALQTIRIDGSLLVGYGRAGLKLNGGNSTIRGLSIFGVTTAARMAGDNNVFEGNSVVNTVQFDNGVNHRAGGLTPAAVNVINGHLEVLASNSVIQGNITSGIGISGSNNLVGGTTAAARNIASGSFTGGIFLGGTNNLIQGNYIGTDITGTVRVHNRKAGVLVEGDGNIIGGTAPGARNIISGNARGVYIFDGSNNVIQGNWIGPDATGHATLSNTDGITITSFYTSSTGNVIGGTEPGAGNVIAGNGGGVSLFLGVNHTTVQGNLIGVLPDGVTPAGNNVDGVFIASDASDNMIGGTAPGAGNVIAHTLGLPGNGTGSGVLIAKYDTITPTHNAVLGNRIFDNAALGIDLSSASQGTDGVTPNDNGDADSGPNSNQNFPVLTSATTSGGSTTVTGSLNSRPSSSYRIEFFSSAPESGGGAPEGSQFIGSINITTDANGDSSFKTSLPKTTSPGQIVTATATDFSNDTSEFSAGVVVTKSSKTNPVARLAGTQSQPLALVRSPQTAGIMLDDIWSDDLL